MLKFPQETVRGSEMAYKLRFPDGLVVEVDTASEFQEAVRVMRPLPTPALPAQQGEALPLDAAILRRFIEGLPSKQRLILVCLANGPGSVRDEELRAAIGVEDNSKLGGSMAGLSKRAVSMGLTIEDILMKESWQNGQGRHYSYTITDGMRAVMRN